MTTGQSSSNKKEVKKNSKVLTELSLIKRMIEKFKKSKKKS